MFSEVFYTFSITSVVGLITLCVRQCYKSKCKEVSICCLKIIRDTDVEEKIDEHSRESSREENKVI